MAKPVTVEDQSGAPMPQVNSGVTGQESQKVKCLPAEYYKRFLSVAANDLKLTPSEFTTVLTPMPHRD